jgi:hypothetical protein
MRKNTKKRKSGGGGGGRRRKAKRDSIWVCVEWLTRWTGKRRRGSGRFESVMGCGLVVTTYVNSAGVYMVGLPAVSTAAMYGWARISATLVGRASGVG